MAGAMTGEAAAQPFQPNGDELIPVASSNLGVKRAWLFSVIFWS